MQVSFAVHFWPSSQGPPSLPVGFEQVPLAVSQMPAAWQASLAVQTTGVVPTQLPAVQTSIVVQALLSLQGPPSLPVGFEQAPAAVSQVPATCPAVHLSF